MPYLIYIAITAVGVGASYFLDSKKSVIQTPPNSIAQPISKNQTSLKYAAVIGLALYLALKK